MAETAGSIKYTVETDTSSQLKAEKVVDKTTTAMVSDFKKVDVASKKMGTQLTKSSKAVKTGVAGVGRASGQAGIQVQQFIGQIQGGQNAMLALSAQSADLGFVLGAPLLGAVVGISASLIGILAPALFKTSEAAKAFTFDVVEAAKELENLSDLSKAQVSVAIEKTNKSMKDLSKEAGDVGDRIASLNQVLDDGAKVNVRITKTGRAVIGSTKLTKEETVKLTKELAQEQANLDKISQEYKKESDLLIKLTNNKDGFSKKTSKQKEETDKLIFSLETQTIALRDGEEAAFRFATAQQLGLKVGEQLPANIDAQIAALFRLKKAQEDAKEEETAKAKLGSQVSTIGLSPEDVLIERLNRQNDLLRQARENDLLTEQEFISRKEELNNQHEKNLETLRKKASKDSILNFEALENQVIGTFAAIASGAQDSKTAIKSLAQSVLTQMIGALIKMGIQAAIGQTTAVATGVATAATLASAYAPAAALASLASFGANAAPAAAGISSTVALSQGLAVAGGREHGGPVQAGKMFQVGEGGKPEIFTSGNKNFMIPGDNGRVISNDEAFGGGQTVEMNVTIENNVSNAGVSTNMSEDGKQLRVIIAEVANQISTNQGPIPRALRGSTNTTFKANR